VKRSGAEAALVVGALGVVFGDLGTSPLYTIQTAFNPGDPHPVAVSEASVFGIISLVFWAMTLIVTVTYVLLVMRADNDGEGGIMALITLIRRRGVRGGRKTKLALAGLGIFGASLFFGDSIITPAISVLSAVGGVEVVAPSLGHLVVPITAAIIVVLFLVQRFGSGTAGRFFGPVMALWFAAIASAGIRGIVDRPEILKTISPTYALSFLFGHFSTGFFSLAAVVLAVTGAEALYADMGHFGRPAITRAWLFLVFPACLLSYMGQGALLLEHPDAAVANPFFVLVPHWARVPMIFLAAAATVIASQSVISGAFSLTRQAAQIGYLPRLRVEHTSEQREGQIYVPWINWALMILVLALVVTFKTSTALAYAYGTAVTGTITITTLLFFYVARNHWHVPLWIAGPGLAALLTVDLLFFAANLTKFTHGAWLPLLVGLVVFTVLTTWQRGRHLVTQLRREQEGSLRPFIDKIAGMHPPLDRVPGTAVFLNRDRATTPLAMRANVERNHVLHEHVIILSVETKPAPHVPAEKRLVLNDLGHRDDGITYVSARYGYADEIDVPALIRLVNDAGIEHPVDESDVSYFLSKIDLRSGDTPGMSRWRKALFMATSHLTADAAEYFKLPLDRTVIMGARIEF
jgi:KUP system potassium uptake protein